MANHVFVPNGRRPLSTVFIAIPKADVETRLRRKSVKADALLWATYSDTGKRKKDVPTNF